MTFTINVPDADAPDVLAAFAAAHRYRPQVMAADPANLQKLIPTPNPETQEQFAGRMIREHVAGIVLRYRQQKAQAAAAATVQPVTVT